MTELESGPVTLKVPGVIVDDCIFLLNTACTFALSTTPLSPCEGVVDVTCGAVVGVGEGDGVGDGVDADAVVNDQTLFAAIARLVLSLTPVVIVAV